MLDLAAHITLLDHTLNESLTDQSLVNPILKQILALGGIKDISTLRILKAQGESVYGQVPSYPQASGADVAIALNLIKQALQNLQTIGVPAGVPIAYGPSWTFIESTASDITLESTRYASPLAQ